MLSILPLTFLLAQSEKSEVTSTLPDTLSTVDAEADTIVRYSGSPIEYELEKREIHIFGKDSKPAIVMYKDMTLEAGEIIVLLDSSLIIAKGIIDSNNSYILEPVFRQEGSEPFKGKQIVYNLKTKRGRVTEGKTRYEDGFYAGKNITMIESNMFQINNGHFTNCDKEDHPHFYFKGGKMKMRVDDKIVVKPVIVYIRDIPVFYLPFGVFPIKRGRHSGIIFPTYGSSQVEGRFLRGLGYYWAPNDYIDVKGILDYFEKTGIMFRGDARYVKSDLLSGNITGSITRKDFITGAKERRWDLQIDHKHQINPETNFNINGKFVSSGNFYRNYSLDREYRATRELISNAMLNKNWTESKNSISINASRRQDLELGNISETLPQINFSHSSPIYIFKKDEGKNLTKSKENWYHSINFRYNSVMLNRQSKNRQSEEESFTRTTRGGIQHSLYFLAPQNVFKWIAVNPSFNYKEEWFLKTDKMSLDNKNNLTRTDERGFASRRTFNSGLTANTKFYGLFQPNMGNIKVIRHVVTPSISFNYQPDFSSERFKYYTSVVDSSGINRRYDRFANTIFGGTSKGRSQSFALNLQNLFQMKTLKGEEEKKYDICNINFSTDYNCAAESFKLGDLRTTLRTMSFFDIDVSAVHSFYRFDEDKGNEVNEYIKGLPRLLSFQVSSSFSFTGNKGESTINPEIASEEKYTDTTVEDKQNRFIEDKGAPPMQIPWNFSMGLRYAKSKFNPKYPMETFSLTPKLDFNLTKNWKINYGAEFDLITKQITYQDISFYRDLHCWELRFDWTPTGRAKGFFFIIRIKSPSLKDLKLQKRDHKGSVYIR